MPESVIDPLKAIKIDKMHRGAATLQRQDGKHLLQFFNQLGAIGQTSQRIVMCHVGDLGLSFLPVRDVLQCRNPSAVLHRLFDDAQRTFGRCLNYSVCWIFLRAPRRARPRQTPPGCATISLVAFRRLTTSSRDRAPERSGRHAQHFGVTIVEQP